MPKPLGPTDVLLRSAPRAGWTSERATLSEAEVAALVDLVEPELDGHAREKFERSVQNIFSATFENVRAQMERDGFSVAGLRDDLENFVDAMEGAQSLVDRLDPVVGALIDHELAEVARRQGVARHGPKGSFQQWRAATSDLLGMISASADGWSSSRSREKGTQPIARWSVASWRLFTT